MTVSVYFCFFKFIQVRVIADDFQTQLQNVRFIFTGNQTRSDLMIPFDWQGRTPATREWGRAGVRSRF